MPLSRRSFLIGAAGFAASGVHAAVTGQPRLPGNPFTLGVASGYPSPHDVMLWTRLAPDPTQDGGMPPLRYAVAWEVAADPGFGTIVRRGSAFAQPEWGHSVHVQAAGLEPARWYYYRFRVGDAVSPVGRTRTAPPAGAAVDRLRLAFASCQQYEQGYYGAYRHLAAEELDLVLHLGDYIYESSWGRHHVRSHNAGEPVTLAGYRDRYALYKSDPDLQAAHAAFPWLVTWDDHEVQNDYANDRSQFADPPEVFLSRRAAAYQAYYEHMPLPPRMKPRGPALPLHTRCDFGTLARIHVLDDRQYRDPQACPRPERGGGSNVVPLAHCPELLEPDRTLLGAAQERWLHEGLAGSGARWNVIAQQTMMSQVDRLPGEGHSVWTDGWDGYPKARERLLGFIADRQIANPVVLGGDVHTAVVADLKPDFDDPRSPVVATEFVGTSLTSQGISQKALEIWRSENPHIRYANSARRGYTTLELATRRCRVRMRAVYEKEPDSPVRTQATWVVESGRAGAQGA